MNQFPNQGNGMGAQGFSPGQGNMTPDPNALIAQLVSKDVIINDLTAKLNQSISDIEKLKAKKIKHPLFFDKDPSGVYCAVKGDDKVTVVGMFKVHKVTMATVSNCGEYQNYLLVKYSGDTLTQDTAIVPYQKLCEHHLMSYFPEYHMPADCSRSLAEKFLYMKIINHITEVENPEKIFIPKTAGFACVGNGVSFYSASSFNNNFLNKILPVAIKERKLTMHETSAVEIAGLMPEFINPAPEIITILGYHIAGVMSSIFYVLGINACQILVISSMSTGVLRTAVSLLKVFNRPSLDALALDSSKAEINKALTNSKDEVVIFGDVSITQNDKKRTETLDLIVRKMLVEKTNPYMAAVVSNAAQYLLPADIHFHIELNDEVCFKSDEQCLVTQAYMEKVDSCIIQYICNNYNDVFDFLEERVCYYKEKCDGYLSSNAMATLVMVMCALDLTERIFGVKLISEDLKHLIFSALQESSKAETGNEFAIFNEFSKVFNKAVADGRISVTERTGESVFYRNSYMAVISNGLMFMEENTLSNVILPQMTTTKNLTRLIKSLKSADVLSATNNNTHPLRVKNSQGNMELISMYAFRYQDVLDSSNLDYMQSLQNQDFLNDADKVPENILPLVVNSRGQVAGKKIIYRDKENCHISITGKSGQGKTVLMSQILAGCNRNGDKIVVFDSSESFSKKELCRNLTADYVAENVTFHSIDEKGIPVNMFDLKDITRLPQKKNVVAGVLSAAVDNLSDNQKKLLKTSVSASIESEFSFFQFLDNLAQVKENKSAKTLYNKYLPVYEDLESYGGSSRTWDDVFADLKGIIVISMDSSFSDKGNYLFDMLLVSLFNYQLKNNDTQLSVFIDEIQNQNLGPTGAIGKIMKEGRKFGMALMFATQVSSKGSNTSDKITKQAGTQIFFKPDASSENAVADMLGFGKKEHYKLKELKIGECFVQGDLFNNKLGYNDSVVIKGKTYTHFDVFNK